MQRVRFIRLPAKNLGQKSGTAADRHNVCKKTLIILHRHVTNTSARTFASTLDGNGLLSATRSIVAKAFVIIDVGTSNR